MLGYDLILILWSQFCYVPLSLIMLLPSFVTQINQFVNSTINCITSVARYYTMNPRVHFDRILVVQLHFFCSAFLPLPVRPLIHHLFEGRNRHHVAIPMPVACFPSTALTVEIHISSSLITFSSVSTRSV